MVSTEPKHLMNVPLFFCSKPFLVLFVPIGQSARLVFPS